MELSSSSAIRTIGVATDCGHAAIIFSMSAQLMGYAASETNEIVVLRDLAVERGVGLADGIAGKGFALQKFLFGVVVKLWRCGGRARAGADTLTVSAANNAYPRAFTKSIFIWVSLRICTIPRRALATPTTARRGPGALAAQSPRRDVILEYNWARNTMHTTNLRKVRRLGHAGRSTRRCSKFCICSRAPRSASQSKKAGSSWSLSGAGAIP